MKDQKGKQPLQETRFFMKKTIHLSLGQIVLILFFLMLGSAGLTSLAQWRYNLLDRLEIKLMGLLNPQPPETEPIPSPTSSVVFPTPTPVNPSLPSVLEEPGMAMNVLAVQSPLPTEADLALDPAEDQAFLQSILDTLFPEDMSGLTEEQIVIEIQRYVSTSLRLENNSGTATKILTEGYAICGGMNISFQALVRKAGIPAHYIGMFGVIYQSHVLTEIYYDGQWHLYDPTYGLFFYSEPEYNHAGHILSFAEVLSTAPSDWYLFKVVDQPWVGYYDQTFRSFGVVRAEEQYLTDHYRYPFMEAYRKMFTQAFPIAYEDHQIISFPVEADFSAGDTFSIGTIDTSTQDVAASMADTFGRTGSSYMGGSPLEEVHTWFLKAPFVGYVRIIYISTAPDPPHLLLFPLKAVNVLESVQEGNRAEFLLRIGDPEASLQFWASEGVFWVDAVQAEWLGDLDPSEIP